MNDELIIGTDATFLLTIEPIGGVTAKDFDFDLEVYTNPKKKLKLSKYDHCIPAEKEDGSYGDGSDGRFYVMIETSYVGIGEIIVDVIAYVRDERYDLTDGYRTEKVRIETGILIIP